MEEITKGTRIINFFIDTIAFLTLYTFINTLLTTFVDGYMLYYFTYIGYYFCFEFFNNGQTLGKMITKTRVVNLKHEKPNFRKILWRTLLRLNPFDTLSFLCGQNGHDSVSKTKLVYKSK